MEAISNMRLVVDKIGKLETILSDRLEQWKLPAEVLSQTIEALKLTREINHPMILSLQIPQRLRLKLVCNYSYTLLHGIPTNACDALPQNLLCVLGRNRASNKHCPPIQTSLVRKIHSQIHQTLFPQNPINFFFPRWEGIFVTWTYISK
jgi:hypothetical protein